MKASIRLLRFINLRWIVNSRKNAWNSLLSVGDSRYIITKKIGYVIDKWRKRKRRGKKLCVKKECVETFKVFFNLLNFNRFSKLMNLTRTYINTDKTNEKIKVQFPKKIDRDLSVFRPICTFERKKQRMIEINKLATG